MIIKIHDFIVNNAGFASRYENKVITVLITVLSVIFFFGALALGTTFLTSMAFYAFALTFLYHWAFIGIRQAFMPSVFTVMLATILLFF